MAFGQDYILKGFTGTEGVADYAHAAKTFLTNGYQFAPRHKYLFHVYFTINTAYVPALRSAFSDNQEIVTIGLMVKNVQLPNYQINVETMNQYNRKRLVQTKIDYQPVQFGFHDGPKETAQGQVLNRNDLLERLMATRSQNNKSS